MKKLMILLSLLVISIFVVSCAPKELGEEGTEEDGALAGQAVHKTKKVSVPCKDTDNPQNLIAEEINSFFVKGTVTDGNTPKGGITDSCSKDAPNIIVEGTCKSGKYEAKTKNCQDGSGVMTCQDGACVPEPIDVTGCEKIGGDDPLSPGQLYLNEYVINKESYAIDECISKQKLLEKTCNLAEHQSIDKIYDCSQVKEGYVCKKGVCVNPVVEEIK